jgi:alkylation response protein AidB-like acyl-CoA dehydrogenase
MIAETDLDQLRLEIRHLAETKIGPYVHQGETEARFPIEVREAMAAAGCFGRTLPTEFGGRGEGLQAFATQQEELARVWPTAAVAGTWANLSGRLLSRFASPEQRAELIPGLVDGTGLGAVGFTEPHGGSDAAGIRTTARRDGDDWVLDGSKRMIDNSGNAAFIIVSARTDPDVPPHQGISLFIIRRDDPGFEFGGVYRTLGVRAAGVGHFAFRECRIPGDRLVGPLGRGFYEMMDMVEFGRTGLGAICLGMAEASLAAATRFLAGRTTFGQRLSENAAILPMVADLRIGVDAARLLVERAARLVDAGARCDVEAAIAKVFASELAVHAASTALHLHGGIGYTDEESVEMFLRDAHGFTIGEGTSEVLRMVIGRREFRRTEANGD